MLTVQALVDWSLAANWTSVAILYQYGLAGVLELEQRLLRAAVTTVTIAVDEDTDWHEVITKLKRHNTFNLLLDLDIALLPPLFTECRLARPTNNEAIRSVFDLNCCIIKRSNLKKT